MALCALRAFQFTKIPTLFCRIRKTQTTHSTSANSVLNIRFLIRIKIAQCHDGLPCRSSESSEWIKSEAKTKKATKTKAKKTRYQEGIETVCSCRTIALRKNELENRAHANFLKVWEFFPTLHSCSRSPFLFTLETSIFLQVHVPLKKDVILRKFPTGTFSGIVFFVIW